MECANNQEIWFITGLTGNKALFGKIKDWVEMAQNQFKQHGEPIRFLKTFPYKAGSWKYAQRALYFNIPMIITNTEGMEYFIKKGNCTCVPQEAPNYLANKIGKEISLLSGKLSANKNYPFPLTNCMEQYEKLYHNLYYTVDIAMIKTARFIKP
jgi:hypothetical protein